MICAADFKVVLWDTLGCEAFRRCGRGTTLRRHQPLWKRKPCRTFGPRESSRAISTERSFLYPSARLLPEKTVSLLAKGKAKSSGAAKAKAKASGRCAERRRPGRRTASPRQTARAACPGGKKGRFHRRGVRRFHLFVPIVLISGLRARTGKHPLVSDPRVRFQNIVSQLISSSVFSSPFYTTIRISTNSSIQPLPQLQATAGREARSATWWRKGKRQDIDAKLWNGHGLRTPRRIFK
jgi:hypothetical protein